MGPLSQLALAGSNLVLLIMFIWYQMYGYETYGAETFFRMLYRLTDGLCRPMRTLVPYRLKRRRDYTPVLAMGLILLMRGAIFAMDEFFKTEGADPVDLLTTKTVMSLELFVAGAYKVIIVLLFIAAALHQSGEYFYSDLFSRVLVHKTEGLFGKIRKVVRTNSFWLTYLMAAPLAAALAGGLTCLLQMNNLVWAEWGRFTFRGYRLTLTIYSIALFIFIIMSWLRPQRENPVIRIIEAIVLPSITWARRTFPWAVIDVFDLSPIFLGIGVSLLHYTLYWLANDILRIPL